MTRRPFLARLGASLAALLACPGCLKRAEATPSPESLPHVVIGTGLPPVDILDLRVGDWVVCRKGHLIGEISEVFDDGRWPTIGKWQQPEPAVGSRPVCSRCGLPLTHPRLNGVILVTERYWLRHGWPE